MDSLPNELLVQIFRNINLTDLINNLKLVCKRWWSVINEHLKFNELILIQEWNFYNNYWYYTYNSINFDNLIRVKHLIIDESFANNFAQLKYLKINFEVKCFDLSYFNRFVQLEHFEFKEIDNFNRTTTLCLPKLRVFFIELRSNNHSTLIVDSPNLAILCSNNLELIRLVHLSSLKFLESSTYSEQIEFNKFVNLQTLKLRKDFGFLYDNVLLSLPNTLTRLHLYTKFFIDKESMIDSIEHIREQHRLMNKTRIEIYFNGVRLVYGRSKDEYDFDLENIVAFHHRNHHLLDDNLSFYTEFDYDKLASVYRTIPADFHQKFVNIQKVKAMNRIENEEQFTWFLCCCKNLSNLELKNTSLSLPFYERLPNTARSLSTFYLFDEDKQLDYEFISRFDKLTYFSTLREMTFDSVLSIVRNLKYFEEIRFKNSELNVCVYKEGKRCGYNLEFNKNYSVFHRLIFDCLAQLEAYIEQIRMNDIAKSLIETWAR